VTPWLVSTQRVTVAARIPRRPRMPRFYRYGAEGRFGQSPPEPAFEPSLVVQQTIETYNRIEKTFRSHVSNDSDRPARGQDPEDTAQERPRPIHDEVLADGPDRPSRDRRAEKRLRRLGRSLLTWQAALWAGSSLVLILGALAIVVFTGGPSTETATATLPQVTATDITYGPEGAPVVVVEYSDFQCEACARFAPMLAALRAKYGDRVRFVSRFFPLINHPYGMLSAQVAYAASLQSKFWEMQDLLYERQSEWSDAPDAYPYFKGYAKGLGLDMSRFRNDLNAQTTKDFITRQMAEGTDAGVNHTPWFVVNGTVLVPNDIADFEALIDAGL